MVYLDDVSCFNNSCKVNVKESCTLSDKKENPGICRGKLIKEIELITSHLFH